MVFSIINSEEINLPNEVVLSIFKNAPITTILGSLLTINKQWSRVGTSNLVWIPRYAMLTGRRLDPYRYEEGEVYELFMREWLSYVHVWMRGGRMHHFSYAPGLVWVDPQLNPPNSVVGNDIRFRSDDSFVPIPGNYFFTRSDILLLVTWGGEEPALYRLIRKGVEPLRIEDISDALMIHSDPSDLLGRKIIR